MNEEKQETSQEVAIYQQRELPPALLQKPEEFLQTFTPVKVMRMCKEITTPVQAAQQTELPSFFDVRKQYGDNFIEGYIKLFLINIFEYLGIAGMNDEQMSETVFLLMESENKFLNIADLNIISRKIKQGQIKLTSPVNGAKILEIFAEYSQQRASECYQNSLYQHEIYKKHGYIPQNVQTVEDDWDKVAKEVAEHDRELEENYRMNEIRALLLKKTNVKENKKSKKND